MSTQSTPAANAASRTRKVLFRNASTLLSWGSDDPLPELMYAGRPSTAVPMAHVARRGLRTAATLGSTTPPNSLSGGGMPVANAVYWL